MEVVIGKNITIHYPTEKIRKYCEEKLILSNPAYEKKVKMGFWVGNTPEQLRLYAEGQNKIIVPFGCAEDIFALEKHFLWKTIFSPFKAISFLGSINLYDYQQKALKRLLWAKSGVLEAPCGSGKTRIGIALIKEIGGKALWLTHTHSLLKQSEESARSLLPSATFSETTEGKVDFSGDITFATVQTLSKIDPSFYENEFSVVIVDEAHHCVGTPTQVTQFYHVLCNCNCRYKYGLTATPKRADGLTKSMFACLGKIQHKITEREVGEKIIKAKHIVVPIELEYDILSYSSGDGMMDYGKLSNMLAMHAERNALIVEKTESLYNERKGQQLLLCHRISQVKELAKLLRSRGEDVSEIYGETPKAQRNYKADFIVATYALAKEGLDIPTLDCVHFCAPIKDEITIVQSAGRVERNYKGKITPLVLDYVDVNIPYCLGALRKRKQILKKVCTI